MVAVTAQVYSVPLTIPVTLTGDAAPDTVSPFGLQLAVKLLIGVLPALAGTPKAILAWPLPGVAVPMMGALGGAPVMVIEIYCRTNDALLL